MYASAKRAHLWNCHLPSKILFIIDRWPPFYILAPLPYQPPLACPQAVPSMCVCRVFLSQLFQKQQLCVQQSRAASHSFEQKVAPSLTRVVPYRQPTRSCGQCSHSHSHKHIWTKNWQKENQNTIDWLIPENGDLFSDQKIPVVWSVQSVDMTWQMASCASHTHAATLGQLDNFLSNLYQY